MREAKIYQVKHAKTPWQVCVHMPGGKRLRKHFADRKEAEAHAKNLNDQFAFEGVEGVRFGAVARSEYSAAVKRLGDVGASLPEAVEFYLRHNPGGVAKLFDDAMKELLASKRTANRRKDTLRTLEQRLKTFRFICNVEKVSDITAEMVSDFLLRKGLSPRTRAGYRAALSNFFKFARLRGWMRGDPLLQVAIPSLDPVSIRILTVDQASRVMTATARYAGGYCVRAVALRLLAGLRPSEVGTLNENDIRNRVIRVSLGKIRGRRAVRLVPISPALRGWLDLYEPEDAPLTPINFRRAMEVIKKRAGVKAAWCADICRKTWISHRLAETNDEKLVAREAGNSPDTIYQHYFDLVEPEDGRRFGAFSILL